MCAGTTQNYLYPSEKLQPIQIFNLIYALIFIIFNKLRQFKEVYLKI